ncbi:MAG: Alpha-D-kanosaminyltransferase [Chloroflexi bacterium]|nr:Alpha-D-kanosaminyltransferase [Chloroflexota bacterium]
MRVCYFGTYRAEYSRNQIMIAGLRANGVCVFECHERLWHGIDDRVDVLSGGWLNPIFWGRVLKAYWRLMVKYRKTPDHDFLVVGYPGQFDVFLARRLARRRGVPLAWDVFMSLPLIATERGLDVDNPLALTLLRQIEKAALRLPDLLLQDTDQYVKWFCKNYSLSPGRFRLIPTGADDRVFRPLPAMIHAPHQKGKTSEVCTSKTSEVCQDAFHLLYYGTFIPSHGVKYIIEAMRTLPKDVEVHLALIGDGPTRPAAEELAKRYNLKNITFTERLEKEQLVKRIAKADACLGSFGSTPQALMTVQNKVYETLATAKPLITGASPAIADTFQHGTHLYTCERENPAALAQAIEALAKNPSLREKLGREGYAYFQEKFTVEKSGDLFINHLLGWFEWSD